MRLLIGYSQGLPVYLTDKELRTHLHGIGLTQAGKSKLLSLITWQLIKARIGVAVLDPHSPFFWDILKWIVANGIRTDTTIFNPSYEKRIVGFNPFISPYQDEGRLMTRAERLVTSTLRIWGAYDARQYSNIERWLRCIYYVILEQQLSIGDIRYFLYWHQKDERANLIDRLKSQSIRDQLKEFYSNEAKFKQDIESTRNKLQKFIHPQMQRITSLCDNNINLAEIIENKQILLCNFQPAEDELIGLENTRVLGTLLLSELWESFRKRSKPTEFHLLIDECHLYLGPDCQQILTEAAKYGLHLWLFHQYPEQTKDIAGAMKNAQTKITFSQEDSPKEQRNFELRLPNHERINVRVPEIRTPHVSPDRLNAYIERLTQRFKTSDEVDRELAKRPNMDSQPLLKVRRWTAKPKI